MIRTTTTRLAELLELPALPAVESRPLLPEVATARSERVRPKVAPLPLTTVHLDFLDADLLLPCSFDHYLELLSTSGIFAPRRVHRLQSLQRSESPAFSADQPVVGIILNDPKSFRGGGGVRELCEEMRELGCRVVLIPPCADLAMADDPAGRAHGIRSMLAGLDGLIGPGGEDIDPSIYRRPNLHSRNTNPRRDRFEADLALLAKHEQLFMFGICRSHQLWNSADGGDLVQDLEAEGYSQRSRNQKDYGIPRDRPLIVRNERGELIFENRVHLDPKSRLADAAGATSFVTNAFHHQAVREKGNDLEVVGTSSDSVLGRQLVEATERWNGFTVQWHPEGMWKDPIQRRILGSVARRAALFRAAKRATGALGADPLSTWVTRRGIALEPSDLRWLRRDLIPHLRGRLADNR